jgi:hypothetical protein
MMTIGLVMLVILVMFLIPALVEPIVMAAVVVVMLIAIAPVSVYTRAISSGRMATITVLAIIARGGLIGSGRRISAMIATVLGTGTKANSHCYSSHQ